MSDSTVKKVEKLESSDYWCKKNNLELGVDILDPDGWDRTSFEESWDEKITESEFNNRVMWSTVMLNRDKKYFNEMLQEPNP